MRRRLIILIALLTTMVGLWAQTDDDGSQILVFRNTGEVSLFYSNELDSITTNDTAQVFHGKDTTLVVPYSELDSVAVGSRNEAVFHDGVKRLTNAGDFPWIIRFDGESIFYRKDTPSNILPSVGAKLFYGLEEYMPDNTIFPYGLSAKVTGITQIPNEIKVDVELIELDEIFSHLFYAGRIYRELNAPTTMKSARRKIPVYANVNLEFNVPLAEVGNLNITGKVVVSGDAVVSLRQSYANLDLEYGYGSEINLNASKKKEYHYEEILGSKIFIGSFYGLIRIEADGGAFADLDAEFTFGVDMKRTYHRKLLWKQKGNENFFEFRDVNAQETHEEKAKTDLTLDGTVFFGPLLRVDFIALGKLNLGARAKVKIGPEIEGKVNIGLLREMRNYQSEAYGNAKLDFRGKVEVGGYTLNRHYLVWGDVDEHKIYDFGRKFGGHTLQLFPDYRQSVATASTDNSKRVIVDMATAVPEPPITDLETGFEIIDPQGEVVDSVYVGTIKAELEESKPIQKFNTDMILPKVINQKQLEGYKVRPVFHYAGYTISAQPVGISKDVHLQPFSFGQSNGAMTLISAGPFLGEVTKDSTNYRVGAYLPVPLKQNVYKSGDEYSINPGIPLSEDAYDNLIGTWKGTVDGNELTIVFEEDNTGKYNKIPFVYELNTPQSGSLQLAFEDGENLILQVISITETTLRLNDKRNNDVHYGLLVKLGSEELVF